MAKRRAKTDELRELTEHFKLLGAVDPAGWAKSQIEEGIPQYARFVFLRQMWTNVVPEGDTSWIELLIKECAERPRDPGTGAGPALSRMLAAGASPEDIAEVVRVMQWRTLHGIAYQLDDPEVVDYPNDDMPRVNWCLIAPAADGESLQQIDSLHESVLDTEPSGREMRPKGVGREG